MTSEEFKNWKKFVAAYGETYRLDARTNAKMANQIAAYSPRIASTVRAIADALDDMARLAKDLEQEDWT